MSSPKLIDITVGSECKPLRITTAEARRHGVRSGSNVAVDKASVIARERLISAGSAAQSVLSVRTKPINPPIKMRGDGTIHTK